MSTTTNTQIATFLDTIGRTILGEINKDLSTDDVLAVNNPVVLHVVPQDQNGKMAVQLLPIFFKEFLAAKDEPVTFKYKKSAITESTIDSVDFRLQAQYVQMFNPNNVFVTPDQNPANQPQTNAQEKVVKLFEE